MSMSRKEFLKSIGIMGAGVFLAQNHTLANQGGGEDTPSTTKPRIEYEKKRLELFHTWTITRGSADYKENVLVYYHKDGVTGIGEASHMTAAGQNADRSIEELKKIIPLYEESDPWQFFYLPEKAQAIIPEISPAKAALDIALMDWIGKKLNTPLYRMFGLDSSYIVNTSFSIGIDKPDVMQQKVKEAEVYKILKVKLLGKNDEEVISTLRKVTDKPIRVDINQGWTDKEAAVRKIEWMAKQNIEMIEQPMPVDMIEETRWIKERSPLPIVADEAVETTHDIPKLAEAYHGINIKLMKSGGIQEAYRMALLGRAYGLDIMFGCMIETSAAISAAAQLQPFAKWVDLDGNLLIKNDPFEGVKFVDGHWVLNDLPGIGIQEKS